MPMSSLTAQSTLLREQRYRRRFLADDRRQTTPVIVLVSLAFYATARNDLLLLRETALLGVVLGAKLCQLTAVAIGLVLLRHAKRPREQDRAFLLINLATCSALVIAVLSRLPTGEVPGPMFGVGAVLSVLYFAQRAPIAQRTVIGVLLTLASLVLLWGSRGAVTTVSRYTGSLALIVLSLVGVLSMYTFETQRRMRFAAERRERLARQELARKIRELAAEKERAEAMSRVRTAFLAAMSHEFRTPMNAVIGLSDLLLDTLDTSQAQDYLRTIRESARALLALLNDILDFAKIDAGRLDLAKAVFDLVQAMDSDIHVRSEPGRGSTFSFSLFLPVPAEPPDRSPTSQPVMPAKQRSLVILVVDDLPINVRVASMMLDRLGHHPDSVSDGHQALRAVMSKAYDVVLMDLHMPGMSGLDTSRRIREQLGEAAPHIIAMTASVFETDRQACKQAGMQGFIGKPIDFAELQAALGQVAMEGQSEEISDGAMVDTPDRAIVNAPGAAIMHELNQPFTAALLNAETALALLELSTPDVAGAREALGDLLLDCKRAAQAMSRLRVFLRESRSQTVPATH